MCRNIKTLHNFEPPASDDERNLILVAHDLSPADVIQFKQHQFASFITDVGGTTSHTAIVARSLAIPSIVALHQARQLIRENELLIVDGTLGMIIVDPDPQALAGLLIQPSLKSMFSFGLLILVLLFRPQGLLGKRA